MQTNAEESHINKSNYEHITWAFWNFGLRAKSTSRQQILRQPSPKKNPGRDGVYSNLFRRSWKWNLVSPFPTICSSGNKFDSNLLPNFNWIYTSILQPSPKNIRVGIDFTTTSWQKVWNRHVACPTFFQKSFEYTRDSFTPTFSQGNCSLTESFTFTNKVQIETGFTSTFSQVKFR